MQVLVRHRRLKQYSTTGRGGGWGHIKRVNTGITDSCVKRSNFPSRNVKQFKQECAYVLGNGSEGIIHKVPSSQDVIGTADAIGFLQRQRQKRCTRGPIYFEKHVIVCFLLNISQVTVTFKRGNKCRYVSDDNVNCRMF